MALPIQKRSQILKDLQLFCEYLCDGQRVIDITMDDLANPQVNNDRLTSSNSTVRSQYCNSKIDLVVRQMV